MKRMTRQQLAALLFGIQGSTMVGMNVSTEPKMRKTDNPFYGKVRKLNTVNGIVNFYYEDGVLRRLAKEGKSPDDYKRGESWHEPVLTDDGKLTPLCRHKKNGDEYLRFQWLKSGEPVYVDEKGQQIDKAQIEPFLQEPSGYGNQGVDVPLKILTYKLDSIKRISIKGEEIEVIG